MTNLMTGSTPFYLTILAVLAASLATGILGLWLGRLSVKRIH